MLLALTLGGRRLFDRVRAAGRGPALQRALGAVMIVTAVAILTNVDVNFDQFVAQHIPDVNLTASLECSNTVTGRLHEISGHQPKFAPANGSSACGGSRTRCTRPRRTPARRRCSPARTACQRSGRRPNSAKPRTGSTRRGGHSPPLTLASLRGHVVLVDFWTYTCINCIRTLPYLKAWDATYRQRRPHDRRRAHARVRLRARRLQRRRTRSSSSASATRWCRTTNIGTWNAYGNQSWPADYLIDASGQVRYAAFGEGDYDQTETAIRALLAEAGASVGGDEPPAPA